MSEQLIGGDMESPAQWSVIASVAQVEGIVRDHEELLAQAPRLSRDDLANTAESLAGIADYLTEIGHAHSQFLSKVSHELRTPLTIAKGWMSMLHSGELTPEQERIVTVVDQQIDELTRLVNDLMDLSRQETGTLDLRLEAHDMAELIEQVAEYQCEVATLQGIKLVVASHQPGLYARVDRGRMAQVLNNLISNAFRYVPHHSHGQVVLSFQADTTTVQASVRDNGCGISPEHLPRIFEPFYQIDGRQRGKSGLGLAIVQELVRAHGGSLTVESTLGVGTTFHIRLRRVAPPAKQEA